MSNAEEFVPRDIPYATLSEDECIATTHKILSDFLNKGYITEERATFLYNIRSFTTHENTAYVNCTKISASLFLGSEFPEQFSGQVAYVGSGDDWRFPVACGATTIDLIDLGYTNKEKSEYVFQDIREDDHQAQTSHDPETNIPTITFQIDWGSSVRYVTARLLATDARGYVSSMPLTAVLEFNGPTHFFEGEATPVLPNIRSKLASGAVVANFDFVNRSLIPKEIDGLTLERVWEFAVYRNLQKQSI